MEASDKEFKVCSYMNDCWVKNSIVIVELKISPFTHMVIFIDSALSDSRGQLINSPFPKELFFPLAVWINVINTDLPMVNRQKFSITV